MLLIRRWYVKKQIQWINDQTICISCCKWRYILFYWSLSLFLNTCTVQLIWISFPTIAPSWSVLVLSPWSKMAATSLAKPRTIYWIKTCEHFIQCCSVGVIYVYIGSESPLPWISKWQVIMWQWWPQWMFVIPSVGWKDLSLCITGAPQTYQGYFTIKCSNVSISIRGAWVIIDGIYVVGSTSEHNVSLMGFHCPCYELPIFMIT